jgi:flavin-dependent dehydrogenase
MLSHTSCPIDDLSPTLRLAEAARTSWDVAILGAGPAGSFAARELARRNLKVLLVDKDSFPRWKVCGACLNAGALATLAAVGLGNLPAQFGAVPLTRLHVAALGREACHRLPAGAVLSRDVFDAALVREAVRSGAVFLPRTRALRADPIGNEHRVWLRQSEYEAEISTRLVIVATGLGGRLVGAPPSVQSLPERGSRIGLGVVTDDGPAYFRPGTVYLACGRMGYVGLARLQDGRLNIATALDPASMKNAGGPGKAVDAVLAEVSWPRTAGLADLGWRGTPELTRRPARLAWTRAFIVGDAAGYVEPFTGEGIAWALAAGQALVPLAERAARRWEPALADEWTNQYRRLILYRQRRCRLVATVLRSSWLTRALIDFLKHVPSLAEPLVRSFCGPIVISH